MTTDDALSRYRSALSARSGDPLRLASTISPPAGPDEIERAWAGNAVAADAVEFWRACRSAQLFKDIDYGQWGLAMLEPGASARRTARERAVRPAEYVSSDVVIGEFLGDQELLVVAPSEEGARRILVALPLDPRRDWFAAGTGLAAFLDAYFDAGGDKFWEPRR